MNAGDYLSKFENEFELRFIKIDYYRNGILFDITNPAHKPFFEMISKKYMPDYAVVIKVEPYGDCLLCNEGFIKRYIIEYIIGGEECLEENKQ